MMGPHILLTVDVEDWFQVENFKSYIPFSAWPSYELRVEGNTRRLLDLLDAQGNGRKPRATFFILGWLAERLPSLVREIHDRGHEVASHGYGHNLCFHESYNNLIRDLTESKKLLEEIIGGPVAGYRAPSFSVTDDILKIIRDCGYLYDSSFNSFGMNSRYGRVNLAGGQKRGIAVRLDDGFWELPVSNLKIGKRVLPLAGGGYFRLFPFPLFRQGIRRILAQKNAYLFYMHPWEIDPGQPRVHAASAFFKFRHYINLKSTFFKLERLLTLFDDCEFVSCRHYVTTLV